MIREKLAETLVLLAGIGVVLYIIGKGLGISSLPEGLKKLGDLIAQGAQSAANGVVNGATGKLTDDQIASIAKQTADDVKRAGGSVEQQAAAAAEVTNYANWSKPLGGVIGIGSIDAGTEVPGSGGYSVYDLRKSGYSDEDILSLFDYANQQAVEVGNEETQAFPDTSD